MLWIRPPNAVHSVTLEGSSLGGDADAGGRGLLGAGAGPRWEEEGAAWHTRDIGIRHWQSQFELRLPWCLSALSQTSKTSALPTFNSLFYWRRQLDTVLHHQLQRHRDLVKTVLACKANQACNNYSDQIVVSQPRRGQSKGCRRRVRFDPPQPRSQGKEHRPWGRFWFRPTSPRR